jgi:DNA-binding beta-propeller fold protein YncE
MHPDIRQLVAYIDGALHPNERAELRAHILTCPICTAQVERLRDDARRIAAAMSAAAAPDVRAAVRSHLRRPPAITAWLSRGAAFAGALAALLLFALLIGASRGATAGRIPSRLFITDTTNGQIIALDADSGAVVGQAPVGDSPTSIVYDDASDRVYVLLKQSVVAVDPRTLGISARWEAPQPFDAQSGLALDPRRARLYLPQPGGVVALALDRDALEIAETYQAGQAPNRLALAPDGRTLYALDEARASVWTIELAGGRATAQTLAGTSAVRYGWLAVSPDGAFVYVLLTRAGRGDQVMLWRIDRGGAAEAPALLGNLPPPWDLALLDTGQLAIPRGDGDRGGLEIVDARTLATVASIDPGRDQHHIATGPNGTVFGLNFTHNVVARFDTRSQTIAWRTPERQPWQPWNGVYVPGGWRWPFDW